MKRARPEDRADVNRKCLSYLPPTATNRSVADTPKKKKGKEQKGGMKRCYSKRGEWRSLSPLPVHRTWERSEALKCEQCKSCRLGSIGSDRIRSGVLVDFCVLDRAVCFFSLLFVGYVFKNKMERSPTWEQAVWSCHCGVRNGGLPRRAARCCWLAGLLAPFRQGDRQIGGRPGGKNSQPFFVHFKT